MMGVMNILLGSLILIGWTGAAMALYGRYRALPSFLTGPNICKLEAGGCQVLFRTPNAALLGVPNSALGILYYPLLGAGLYFHWPDWMLFAASSFSFLMTLWLAWVLVRDKLECRVCWTGHLCNSLIWLVLLSRFLF